MFRPDIKTRVLEDGRVEIVDPDIEALTLLKAIDPEFRIRRTRLRNFSRPRLLSTRTHGLPLKKNDLKTLSTDDLWMIHDNALNDDSSRFIQGKATLLDLKIELAARAIRECRICGRECGVDRYAGERGYCGLGVDGNVGECFVHIAEEAQINPSINVNLRGCGLKCRFCQKHELLSPKGPGKPLDLSLWKELRSKAARSISFIGGNPDESICAILRFLKGAPSRFNKPIVWNSNGYAAKIIYKLLSGIVDAYIPDVKFYGEACSRELTGSSNYFEMFKTGIEEMERQNVPIFVRILVLPGHMECCHKPLINHIARYRESIKLNVMDQYYPDYLISQKHLMGRRPSTVEINTIRSYAERVGGSEWLMTGHERNEI
jgi:putative pyruvate formate lyase activating enzyme